MINRLSILDASPILENQRAEDAIHCSLKLASYGDELGYYRYWATEHHDLPGLAGSSPEIILAAAGRDTYNIRLGTGAVLLPHYSPYKVAEVHHNLACLYPGRIDLGVGRAPGGNPETSEALSGAFLKRVYEMNDAISELQGYLNGSSTNGLKAAPVPDTAPTLWLLGTSLKSARLAGKSGLSYGFAQFMSDVDPAEAMRVYKEELERHGFSKVGRQTLIAVSVICAETSTEAESIAEPVIRQGLKREQEQAARIAQAAGHKAPEISHQEKQAILERHRKSKFIGSGESVYSDLQTLAEDSGCGEIMVITHTSTQQERFKSYRCLMESHRRVQPY
ncbi:MsnO8 family LLM class oxidoreductase [Salisediminibacterium selenitireducens]|uniref:Luciferase family oxidoreductase, group 1 n=1 Tax=Bacillus selenitireducens (strain ATCC 700615 / DSM 15326 / MLS10) TaxID=439292 RepID=D6XWU0_BACIE|nr:MsnO8 family LLM class oxidoreductase [Salisediminibacterium selenitireducens]ADH99916.1 luciferase family oxidoreductase, group 1 [[Bacillus] selenitireducens MLS10]